MTIAAGFHHKDGVLLCADMEEGTGGLKNYVTKIQPVEWHNRQGAFVFAGNSDYAKAAIQRAVRRLDRSTSTDPHDVLQSALAQAYKEVVFAHPDHQTDGGLHYWLIMALPTSEGQIDLYATRDASMARHDTFWCAGIGEAYARQIIGSYFQQQPRSERETLHMAAYMLKIVKDAVVGCSGPSQFLSIRNDGSTQWFDCDTPCVRHIEEWGMAFWDVSRELMFSMLEDDATFATGLATFTQQVKVLRGLDLDQASSTHPAPRD